MPVVAHVDLCQEASVLEQEGPSECLRFFVHGDGGDNGPVHTQDADIRPTAARLTGTVDLATTGGWSAVVAASAARKAVSLLVIGSVLLLLWRLLANSAAGDVFSARAVRYVRGIGWLLITGSLVHAGLGLLVSSAGGTDEIVQFGAGPFLERAGEPGVHLTQLALGGLILLLAEAFRHGAAMEAERRLTV